MSDESGRPGGSIRSRDSLFVAKDTTDRDTRELYEFGPFRLEPAERKLLRGSEVVVLTPKAFETLVLLVRNSGRLLEKDELLRMLWPDSFVEEGSLSNNIFVLRKALGDDSEYIETVSKRGYRFVGAVRQLPSAEKALGERRGFASDLSTDRRSPEQAVARVAPSNASRSRRRLAAVAATALAILAIGAALWWRSSPRLPDRSQWVQLTKFPDSVTQPTLSADGRMLAFVRGYSTWIGPGQVYVKMLPDGVPVELTHDNLMKMAPAFSPDGSRIAYTTLDSQFHWDTWVAPILGGEPRTMLRNASGLVWTGQRQVLFSEIKRGIHMGIVSSEENRIGERDIYLPEDEPAMAHESHLSPDGKWVLLVEMDHDHRWLPCGLVPLDGSTHGRHVGPLGGGCTSAAWSPDGKWMYFTANPGGVNHIWRQHFPDGKPEQFTSGPTEEEGVAIAPDGRSFVTAVALQNTSLWVHNGNGERQISLEGNGTDAKFTPDGKKLCYLIVREAPNDFTWYRNLGELQVADVESGRSEPLVPGFSVLDYDVSADGRQVVMSTTDSEGRSRLWVTPFDRSSPPVQVPNVEGGSPRFGPDGEVFFRKLEGMSTFVYRVRPDGSGLRKALAEPVFLLWSVSPDGRWIVGWAPLPGGGPPAIQAFPMDGRPAIQVGDSFTFLSWSLDGHFAFIGGSYVIPLARGETLPRIPAGGFHSEEEIARLPGARRIEAAEVVLGPSPDVYAFRRGTIQRNLYRIPIP
jgi:DNA-binding winged helix-turn-helix (wHTH) protein/Tol biopolymer transport system component